MAVKLRIWGATKHCGYKRLTNQMEQMKKWKDSRRCNLSYKSHVAINPSHYTYLCVMD